MPHCPCRARARSAWSCKPWAWGGGARRAAERRAGSFGIDSLRPQHRRAVPAAAVAGRVRSLPEDTAVELLGFPRTHTSPKRGGAEDTQPGHTKGGTTSGCGPGAHRTPRHQCSHVSAFHGRAQGSAWPHAHEGLFVTGTTADASHCQRVPRHPGQYGAATQPRRLGSLQPTPPVRLCPQSRDHSWHMSDGEGLCPCVTALPLPSPLPTLPPAPLAPCCRKPTRADAAARATPAKCNRVPARWSILHADGCPETGSSSPLPPLRATRLGAGRGYPPRRVR